MPRKDAIEIRGKVVELLPNNLFRIQLDNGHRVLAHSAGRMRMNLTKILPGDAVMVEMSPYDLTKGRITSRNK